MNDALESPTTRRCPACLGDAARELHAVGSDEAAQHYVLKEVDPARFARLQAHIESLWEQTSCAVVECSDCAFCFADPFVAGDARFYDLAFQRTGYPAWKWEHQRTLDALERIGETTPLSDLHLLEVGAGDGAFIRRVSPAYIPTPNVLCTEYSAHGIEAIRASGVACIDRDVRDLPLDRVARRFDVICMFQVLEHLDRLDSLFETLRDLSPTDAHLFVAVPNERRIAFNERHGSLLDMPPNHVGRWTRASFGRIAERHDWRVVAHEVEEEPAARKVAQHVQYRYLRKRQDPRTVANRIERIRSPWARRALQAVAAGLDGLGALPSLATLLRTPGLGGSQWVHLRKAA